MRNNTKRKKITPSVCQISFDTEDKWSYGIITYINIENHIVEVFLSAEYFQNYFEKYNKVEIKYIKDENEYYISGIIDKKVLSIRKQAIIVKIIKTSFYPNNRKNERYHSGFAATIATNNFEVVPSVLDNISLGGIGLFATIFIDENEKVKVNIIISENKNIGFIGKIVKRTSSNNGFRYSIKIESIDSENTKFLKELLDFLSENKKRITYELVQFARLKVSIYTILIMASLLTLLFVLYSFSK